MEKITDKIDLIKYCWANQLVWNAEYLSDDIDRKQFLDNLSNNRYNLNHKVYLYRSIRNQFKLIGIITNRGVKIL